MCLTNQSTKASVPINKGNTHLPIAFEYNLTKDTSVLYDHEIIHKSAKLQFSQLFKHDNDSLLLNTS